MINRYVKIKSESYNFNSSTKPFSPELVERSNRAFREYFVSQCQDDLTFRKEWPLRIKLMGLQMNNLIASHHYNPYEVVFSQSVQTYVDPLHNLEEQEFFEEIIGSEAEKKIGIRRRHEKMAERKNVF